MLSDITVLISANRGSNRWGFEIQGSHRFAKVAGGVLRGATKHTLLAFSLTSALKSVTARSVANHAVKAGLYATLSEAKQARTKLTVTVKCSRPEFIDSLRSVASLSDRKLRVSERLVREVVRELARFDVRLTVADRSEFHKIDVDTRQLLSKNDFKDGWPLLPFACWS